MKTRKSNLDEMQEQKLLRIEHNGLWFAFWALFAAMMIQTLIGGPNVLISIVGESAVFFPLAGYLLFACIRNGIWDRKFKANSRTNLVVSLITGLFSGVFFFVTFYRNSREFSSALFAALIALAAAFALTLGALSIGMAIYKKRHSKLENGGGH